MTVLLTVTAAFSAIIGVQLGARGGQLQTAQPFSVLYSLTLIPAFLGLIALALAFYGMWMTLRSYAVVQLKMESIRKAEEQMGVSHLVTQKFELPKTGKGFLSTFIVSRRSPLFIVYVLLSIAPVAALTQLLGPDPILAVVLSLAISFSLAIIAIYVQTRDYVKKVQDYLKTTPADKTSAPRVRVAGFFCVAVILYSLTLLSEGSIWRWILLIAASVIAAVTVWLELNYIKLRRLELKARS